VVLLKLNVDERDVSNFLEKELITGSVKTHFRLKDGIASLVKATTQGHRGFAIMFQPYATTEERQTIKKVWLVRLMFIKSSRTLPPSTSKLKENVQGSTMMHNRTDQRA